MTNEHPNQDLHLHDDPAYTQMESLLDQLAKEDAGAMPEGLESRVLDAVSQSIAPAPIMLSPQDNTKDSSTDRLWTLRLAAAAALATGTTLVIVGTNPWNSPTTAPPPAFSLVSLEQDLDAYFSLESLDDGNLSEAMTDWEFWAQTIDSDLNSSLVDDDWDDLNYEEGAL